MPTCTKVESGTNGKTGFKQCERQAYFGYQGEALHLAKGAPQVTIFRCLVHRMPGEPSEVEIKDAE